MLITEIMEYLDNLDIVDYEPDGVDGDIFMGRLPSDPDEAVAIRPTGGFAADMKLEYDLPTVQLTIRGTRDPRTGYNRALEIYDALHGFGSGRLVGGGLWIVSCEGIQSEPVDIGQDENNRFRYTLNFQLDVKRPSRHRG